MSEKFTERPVTIAFDGLHRTGKGTQARLLAEVLSDNGHNSLTVRGDGTREGLGLTAGDPFSLEWQQRNKYIKSENGGSVEDWNASSFVLLRELSTILHEGRERGIDAVIIDRSLLSRAAFLLHRGVNMVGDRMTLDDLYPNNQDLPKDEQLDLASLVPDVIFDLRVRTPSTLLERLDQDDAKYVFRSRNIKGGFDSSIKAKHHVEEAIEERVKVLNATDSPDKVHNKVRAHLQETPATDSLSL